VNLNGTRVDDLGPLAGMERMQEAAVLNWLAGAGISGLSYARTPISQIPPFNLLVQLDQPARTVETINEVRRQQGLSEYIPLGYKPPRGLAATEQSQQFLDPLPGIPSAFGFEVSAGQIKLTSSLVDLPVFPFSTSERDHKIRLEVSRTLANDLAMELAEGRFNARPDYLDSLRKYTERLPDLPGQGNILLADAAARNLRNMFAADVAALSTGLASKLKTILEQHIGLRVYYPEIEHFYRDVQKGRMEAPLSLDAIEGFVRGVHDYTPSVFDPQVSAAIDAGSERGSELAPAHLATVDAGDPDEPKAPPDPLGELNPQKAREFTFASAANTLWTAFREGEKVYQAIDGWRKAGAALQPHVQQILEWLTNFLKP
jgi:hypothetical protein